MASKISLEKKQVPFFSAAVCNDEKISNEAILGKWTILYFYPKDNTPGCTVEAKDFSCLLPEFNQLGIDIIGVSKDSLESHAEFMNQQQLTIKLASDPTLEMHKIFEAWGVKKNYGKEYEGVIRSTFLINPDGVIQKHWRNVRAKGHAERVLKEVKKILG